MKPVAIIADDFFPDFGRVRAWADGAEYADVRSPTDGVVYPGICLSIPGWLAQEVQQGVRFMQGASPIARTLFTRLSLAGSKAPNQAHTDSSMGQYSLMVYLNRAEHCAGGTSLLKHVDTGIERELNAEQAELAQRESNFYHAWTPTLECGMKPNRALIFAADHLHRAEPVGGFGTDARDGRLVLTMFFDKGRA